MRLWSLLLFALPLAAQTPEFEVASIRPSNASLTIAPICGSLRLNAESVLASGVHLLVSLAADAYRDEVDDLDFPQWTRSSRFAVNVKIPPDTSVGTCRTMLQNLLAERFHLVTAVETRDVNRYSLKVAKSGLKLKPVDGPPGDPNASYRFSSVDGNLTYTFRSAPAPRVFNAIRAAALQDALFRRLDIAGVFDETGLTGYYDGELRFTPSPAGFERFPLPQSLEDALVEQLGLALELRRAPGKVLVFRSSDRMPTEN